jgi:hypothetical protein
MSGSYEAGPGDHLTRAPHCKRRPRLAAVVMSVLMLVGIGGAVIVQELHASTTSPSALPPVGAPVAAPSPVQLTLDLVRPCLITEVTLHPGGSARISLGDDSSAPMTSKTCEVANVH